VGLRDKRDVGGKITNDRFFQLLRKWRKAPMQKSGSLRREGKRSANLPLLYLLNVVEKYQTNMLFKFVTVKESETAMARYTYFTSMFGSKIKENLTFIGLGITVLGLGATIYYGESGTNVERADQSSLVASNEIVQSTVVAIADNSGTVVMGDYNQYGALPKYVGVKVEPTRLEPRPPVNESAEFERDHIFRSEFPELDLEQNRLLNSVRSLRGSPSDLDSLIVLANHTEAANITFYCYDDETCSRAVAYADRARAAGHDSRRGSVERKGRSEFDWPFSDQLRFFVPEGEALAYKAAIDIGLPSEAVEFVPGTQTPERRHHYTEVWMGMR
jgi:hypothetical protein